VTQQSSFLLGMRARAMGYAFGGFGMACMAPAGGHPGGFADFMMGPAGGMIAGLVLVMVGLSVEETGTLARIRAGIALRLAAAAAFAVTLLWSVLPGAPSASPATLAWTLIAAGGAVVAYGAHFDLAAYRDPRHGQPLRLDSISPGGLVLTVLGRTVTIPVADVTQVALTQSDVSRGVVIGVRKGAGVRREGDGLPWVMAGLHDDRLVVTEHEAGLDAAVLAARIQEAAGAAKGFR
jgi:hypothetical protein